jgi:CHAT domain-containing protein
VYVQTGNPQKSLGFLQKAVLTEETGKKNGVIQNDYIQLLLNLAELYLINGLPDSAMARCRQAEDSLATEKHESKARIAFLRSLLLKEKASVYQHKKDLYTAIALNKRYIAVVDSLLDKPSNHDATIINLGILYTDTRQYTSADSLFRQEIRHLRQSGLTYSYEMQQSIAGLSANLMDQKKYTEASDSLVNLIHLTLDAMKKNFAGMSESDQLQYKNGLNVVFDLLYTCIYSNKTLNKNILSETAGLELERKSLILANQVYLLDKARNSQDTAFSRIYTHWLNNRQLLSRQYSLPYDQRQFNVDSLEQQSETLESKLSAKGLTGIDGSPHAIHTGPAPEPRSANIEFVRFNYKLSTDGPDNAQYAAFIYLPGDSLPVFVHLCSESLLMRLLKDQKGNWIDGDQLTQKIYDPSSAGAGALYHLLWQPIERYLNGVTQIHYSTSGLLNNIAFHVVYNGKKYLYQLYTFHRYLSLLDAGRQGDMHEPHKTISIWGNMNYDTAVNINGPALAAVPAVSISAPGITTTAYTKGSAKGPLQSLGNTEIDKLKKIFTDKGLPFTCYEREDASEENFKKQAADIKGVLHISTHGFYMPFRKGEEKEAVPGNFMAAIVNPLFRCGLAFSGINFYWLGGKARGNHEDGMLTGYEIAQLDLRQVELVTLSACETGLGDVTDDEGNLGLQRAFKLAGAGKLLVSLWQVPAKQTAELLSLFYTNWLEGATISEALRSAQYALQAKNYPPYYWAGFVLIE